MNCIHCGKSIKKNPHTVDALLWIHDDGFFNCGGRPGHAETYAEPPKVEAQKERK